jgi:putative ABC transport system ATP-binding protein
MSQPIVAAHRVTRAFGPTLALRGADLAVARGEILAVMGPSGSGKSTLLHCLAGILTPDGGEVVFDGIRVDQLDEHARTELRRRRFGFVFQFGQLVPELSAVENVALPLLLEGRSRRRALAEAAPWFGRLGIEELQARRPGELSGGEAQRVALARALVTGPDVIFADEPTGSLDTLAGERVMDLLVDSARAQGTTVLVVTHEARVAAYADREVVVRDGVVVDPAGAGTAPGSPTGGAPTGGTRGALGPAGAAGAGAARAGTTQAEVAS